MQTKAQAHAQAVTAQYGPPLDCTGVREIGWRKLQSGRTACLYDWQTIPGNPDEKPDFEQCPKCGSMMLLKTPPPGKTWPPFLGCSRFPDCRETRRV